MRGSVVIIYDKQCPACSLYCSLLKIREEFGDVNLVDARGDYQYQKEIRRRGWSLDEGFVVALDKELYFGSDAIHMLALISSNNGIFNKANYFLFKSSVLAKIIYPILRLLRRTLLIVMRRKKIDNTGK